MARDDYGAINVISEEEREILGIGGSKKPDDEEEKLFETIGKAADKIGETKVGRKIGTILTVIMLALLSGGANVSIISEYFADEEVGPIGGCLEANATNYNP
jgi:tetrahydromethanopterin S-methyltransferase subunit G